MTDNDHPDSPAPQARQEAPKETRADPVATVPRAGVVIECPDPAVGMVAYRWWPPADWGACADDS